MEILVLNYVKLTETYPKIFASGAAKKIDSKYRLYKQIHTKISDFYLENMQESIRKHKNMISDRKTMTLYKIIKACFLD